jgi:ribosome-associated heat shock protein Hsp15
MNSDTLSKLRADKWLHAARFFRTRSLAKAAIEGGKVRMAGTRIKVSRELQPGDELTIRQGREEKTVVVLTISEQRRGASHAAEMYLETPDSVRQREQRAEQRQTARLAMPDPGGRPTRQQRRERERFLHGFDED